MAIMVLSTMSSEKIALQKKAETMGIESYSRAVVSGELDRFKIKLKMNHSKASGARCSLGREECFSIE
jgi:hypothetical protein